tara:strand:- start:190 stop:405 length:216 start_codon:yes stop_codon:yes gene_type:complete
MFNKQIESKTNKQLIDLYNELGNELERVNSLYNAKFINRGDRDFVSANMYEQRTRIFDLMLGLDIQVNEDS